MTELNVLSTIDKSEELTEDFVDTEGFVERGQDLFSACLVDRYGPKYHVVTTIKSNPLKHVLVARREYRSQLYTWTAVEQLVMEAP